MLPTYITSFFVAILSGTAAATKCCPGRFTTRQYHEKVIDNYLDIWAGNLSLVDSTFAPQLTLHGDRFPTGAHGSAQFGPLVNSPAAFSSFVQNTRSGFDNYGFSVDRWAGDGVNVVIRWVMEGVIGKNFKVVPTTLKQGDAVTYNGTEFLTLDACTGLVVEVSSAQDLITFLYNLGNDINLTPLAK